MLSEFLKNTIDRLKYFVSLLTQSSWQFYQDPTVVDKKVRAKLVEFKPEKLQHISPNENGYLVFEKGLNLAWFYQKITIPNTINDYKISGLHCRFNLTWWAETAAIFVNGKLVCEGDLFDSSTRLLLTDNAKAGDIFDVAIALMSPAHDVGALMKSEIIFESPHLTELDAGSLATELQILAHYLEKNEPSKVIELENILKFIPWEKVTQTQEFNQDLAAIREQLIPLANFIKEREFYVLGHAHLDMAWLWTTDETWEVGQRTFQSVLNLQQEFSELTFGHSTPALYEWIENNRPDLWEKIKAAVSENSWEILGGMWVEPDVNLVSGESIIRQFLYGQQYFLEKFGKLSTIAWLPDTFGFPQQLPQISQHCGIEAFGTGKLHWNDTNPFPHGLFWWRSPDDTQLLTFMTPPNVTGIMDTNPITMTDYALKWEEQTGLKDIFWLPGVGDHGGGPTKDMVQVARKWQESPFFAKIQFSTAENYLNQVKNTPSLPIWDNELYLELHRGCYTVHRDQKAFNRRCEILLRQVEIWSAIAQSLPQNNLAEFDFRKTLKDLWKKVLFNQFHDILPGTSIPEVFTEANQAWQTVINTGETLLFKSLEAIAKQINYSQPPHPDAKPLLFFNDLNWDRTEVVSLVIQEIAFVYDHQGQKITSQIFQELKEKGTWENNLSFVANVPSVGYALYWLVENEQALTQKEDDLVCEPEFILENNYLRVEINSETGDIDQIFDKVQQKNILSGAGNQLQAFEDKGQYWDAWDIAPDYGSKPLPPTKLLSIQWRQKGEIRSIIRVKKQINKSTFIQDYCLESQSCILKIDIIADWQEEQVILKTAFPLTIENSACDYETPCGTLRRSPDKDPAKWEVPALRWADLSDGNYGVSLINNSHHGYDAKPNQLRLTLLKSPLWPDPIADRGIHHFSYAIYPHLGTWKEAKTVHHARAFNTPLRSYLLKNHQAITNLETTHSFLNLGTENLILLALKQAESDNSFILRFYEAYGDEAELKLTNDLNLKITQEVNGLEQLVTHDINAMIQPWKIQTYRLKKLGE